MADNKVNVLDLRPITYANDLTDQQAIDDTMKKYGLWILRSMLRVFCQTAAKYTPPNIGRTVIEQKYYTRPIQGLIKLARGGYPRSTFTAQDREALRSGYVFKVLNTKYRAHKRGEAFAYTKGINEAKRLAKIQNRGLARYTWAVAMNTKSIDSYEDAKNRFSSGFHVIEESPIFKRLTRKSPNITKYRFGERAITYRYGVIHMRVINKLSQSERYNVIAAQRATAQVLKWTDRFFSKVKNKLASDVVKMLEKTKLTNIKLKGR